jgi:hypothetical protein
MPFAKKRERWGRWSLKRSSRPDENCDRIFGWIFIVSAHLHAVSSYFGYKSEPVTGLWALCASLESLRVAVINPLRARGPFDGYIDRIALAGFSLETLRNHKVVSSV